MSEPLVNAGVRVRRFWYLDGLDEILIGVIILLQNGLTLLMRVVNSGSFWYEPVVLIYLLLLFVFAACVPRIMAALRERITCPRSGYVRSRLSGWRRAVMAIVFALVIVLIGLLVTRYGVCICGRDLARGSQLVPAVGGFVFGAISVYVSVRQGLPRFLAVGVLSVVLGVAVSIEYPPRLATEIWLVCVACALLCSGGIALWNYVRNVPLAADEI